MYMLDWSALASKYPPIVHRENRVQTQFPAFVIYILSVQCLLNLRPSVTAWDRIDWTNVCVYTYTRVSKGHGAYTHEAARFSYYCQTHTRSVYAISKKNYSNLVRLLLNMTFIAINLFWVCSELNIF